MTKKKINLFLGISLTIGGVFWWLHQLSWVGGDLSLMAIGDNQVEIINISSARGMINRVVVEPRVELWVPGGMGWYPADKMKLIIEKEKDGERLAKLIGFYNFGFLADKVILTNNWQDWKNLGKIMGPLGVVRYWLMADEMITKTEVINQPIVEEKELLSEVMTRDMSNQEFYEKNMMINLTNSTMKNGWGNFMADRLEWMGGIVISVVTGEVERGCRINGGDLEKLAKLWGCQWQKGEGKVVEIVLGEEMEEVVKYSQTYVRSF